MASQETTIDLSLTATQEQAWIEVIHKMDETYADLLHYQVELESKNAALEEAQQFITSIEAAMTDVLIVCDFQGRIQRVNTALERIVGKTSAELLNQPFQSLFTQECLPLVNSFQQKIRATAIHDCEITLQGVHEPVPLAMNRCPWAYRRHGADWSPGGGIAQGVQCLAPGTSGIAARPATTG
jgi:two-component system sensor histidine kinase HupT/HoxJ